VLLAGLSKGRAGRDELDWVHMRSADKSKSQVGLKRGTRRQIQLTGAHRAAMISRWSCVAFGKTALYQ